MKSNPQHRRQVNKQALKHKTKEAARKQFSGAALSFTERRVLLFFKLFCFYFLPVLQVVCGPQSGLSGDNTQALKLRQVMQVTLETFHKSYRPLF